MDLRILKYNPILIIYSKVYPRMALPRLVTYLFLILPRLYIKIYMSGMDFEVSVHAGEIEEE